MNHENEKLQCSSVIKIRAFFFKLGQYQNFQSGIIFHGTYLNIVFQMAFSHPKWCSESS